MRWSGLRLSVTLLTVIPLRGAVPEPRRATAAAAMAWAPAVGLLLGVAAAAVLVLADLADGLGSGKPAPIALDIMRRSDIGPFGTVTLVLTLLIQVAALAQAEA